MVGLRHPDWVDCQGTPPQGTSSSMAAASWWACPVDPWRQSLFKRANSIQDNSGYILACKLSPSMASRAPGNEASWRLPTAMAG